MSRPRPLREEDPDNLDDGKEEGGVLGRRRRGVEGGEERAVAAMAFRVGPRDLFGQSANDVRNEVLRFLSPAERGRLAVVSPQMRSDVGRVNALPSERAVVTALKVNVEARDALERACRVPVAESRLGARDEYEPRALAIQRTLERYVDNPALTELRFPLHETAAMTGVSWGFVRQIAPRLVHFAIGPLKSYERNAFDRRSEADEADRLVLALSRARGLRSLRIPHVLYTALFAESVAAYRTTLEVCEVLNISFCEALYACARLHTLIVHGILGLSDEPWTLLAARPNIKHLVADLEYSRRTPYMYYFERNGREMEPPVVHLESLVLLTSSMSGTLESHRALTRNAIRKLVRGTPSLRSVRFAPREAFEGERLRTWAAQDERVLPERA